MTNAKGYNKGGNGKGMVLPGTKSLSLKEDKIRKAWNKLTNAERSVWNYNFENYKNAELEIK